MPVAGDGMTIPTVGSSKRTNLSSYQVFTLVTNILAVVILLVVFMIFEKEMEPFNRGFFCDDHFIMKPYMAETISAGLLAVLALVFVVVVVRYGFYLFLFVISFEYIFSSRFSISSRISIKLLTIPFKIRFLILFSKIKVDQEETHQLKL